VHVCGWKVEAQLLLARVAENIIKQLTALGFNCDEEDAMGAFQELDEAALRHPPMNLDVAEAELLGMAQYLVNPGQCSG
jgi:1,6-anhydro-N-acetylmuramate kinase